jgi:hypothetical protein
MDARPLPRGHRRVALGLVLAMLLTSSAGCQSLAFMAAYLIKGTDVPAECKLLKDKKVVVVCRPLASLQYRNARVDHNLAEQVGLLLAKNEPKIKIVDHRKVAEWMDEHDWEEYTEVGKALRADMVLGIDLEEFQLYQGQTLFQGRAQVELKLYDCKTGELVFRKRLPRSVYPPNRMVPTSECQESEFRQAFVRNVADQIGRHFYAHDPYADIALDAKALN